MGFLITAQKMKFFIKDFFSKCDQNCRKLQIWSHLLKKYLMENFIFCAVNAEPDETKMKAFWNQYQLKSLNKNPICFKNINKPSFTDLFLANSSKCFEDCLTLETGLLDFYKLIVHGRFPLKITKYRDYKNFGSKVF